MDTSPWDIADIFRLHEAACLIAGVLPLSKRVPDREELPAQAIPIFGKLGSAYVLNWAAHHKNLPEDPKNPKEKMLKSIDEIPPLPELQPLKKLTGELVSREELHRWVKAMGIKSAYSFAPVAEMDAVPKQTTARLPSPRWSSFNREALVGAMDALNAEYSLERQTKMQEMLAKMGDRAYQQYVAAADAVVNRVANAKAELTAWEKSDDRDLPSEMILRKTQTAKANQESGEAEASLKQMRGDFPGEPDATPAPVGTSKTSPASSTQTPDPDRRLKKLRELGGSCKYSNGIWTFKGMNLLVQSEKNGGFKRRDAKTIRADLKEAAQVERDAKRAGEFDGLG